jgi:hypothetical protein
MKNSIKEIKMRRRDKQIKVINELFQENEGERKVLQENNISEDTFRKWMADKYFIATIVNKIKTIKLSHQILLAKLLPAVTSRLIQLCSSENEYVSRKACSTLLELQENKELNPEFQEEEEQPIVDHETAAAVWKAIADIKRKKKEQQIKK